MDYSEEVEDDGDEWRQMLECGWSNAEATEEKDATEDLADAAEQKDEAVGAEEETAEASGTVEFELSDEEGADDGLAGEAMEGEEGAEGDEAEVNTAGAEFREALEDLPEEAPAKRPKLPPVAKCPPGSLQPVAKQPAGKAPVAKQPAGLRPPLAKQPPLAARPPAGVRPLQAVVRPPAGVVRPPVVGANQGVVVRPLPQFSARQGVVVRPPGKAGVAMRPPLAAQGGVAPRPGVAGIATRPPLAAQGGVAPRPGVAAPGSFRPVGGLPPAAAQPQAVVGGLPQGGKGGKGGKGVKGGKGGKSQHVAGPAAGGKAGHPPQQQEAAGSDKGRGKGGKVVRPKLQQGQRKVAKQAATKAAAEGTTKPVVRNDAEIIREAKIRLGVDVVTELAEKAMIKAERSLASLEDSEDKEAKLKKVRTSNLARLITDHDKQTTEGGGKVVKHHTWKGGMQSNKRAAGFAADGTAVKRARTSEGGGSRAVDGQGRQFDMNQVVVNFANVGANFGTKILNRDLDRPRDRQTGLFDWEGVRRCLKFLRNERGWKVTGVINENFMGTDQGSGSHRRVPVPEDIKKMCNNNILETPRITGNTHSSADDEMTIRSAHRRNCRFLDNDNYRDWLQQLKDEKVRAWLVSFQDMLQLRYYWDKGTGTFELLEGNVPDHMLASGVKNVEKKTLWTASRT